MRSIKDASAEDQKDRKTKVFFWFTSLLECFFGKSNEILIRYKNKLSFERQLKDLTEKMKLLDEVITELLKELPMPQIRSKLKEINNAIKTIINFLVKNKIKEAEGIQKTLKKKN